VGPYRHEDGVDVDEHQEQVRELPVVLRVVVQIQFESNNCKQFVMA
jgi:hypothetical protein